MHTLNPAQRAAVLAPGHVVVMACPGSGKTTVLQHRVAYLVQSDPATTVAAVTFTNEAATELEQRLKGAIPDLDARILIGTLHSLAKRQLAQHGLRRKLLNERQQEMYLRRAFEPWEGQCGFEAARQYIERRKAGLPSPPGEEVLEAVYQAYQNQLQQIGAWDFADLILIAVEGMEEGRIAPLPVRHLVLDEAQDIDTAQLRWIEAHVRAGVTLTAVGDDDQCIYGFRHALGYHGITKLARTTNAQIIRLDTMYRCAPAILTHASRLIAINHERITKPMRTVSCDRAEIRVSVCAHRIEEAERIAEHLEGCHPSQRHQWAVLARTNRLLDEVEQALTIRRIPCTRFGGASFWEGRTPSLFIALLSSLVREDMVGVDQVLQAARVSPDVLANVHHRVLSNMPHPLRRFLAQTGSEDYGKEDVIGKLRWRMREWRALLNAGRIASVAHGAADWMVEHVPFLHDEAQARVIRGCAETVSRMGGSLTLAQRLAWLQKRQRQAKTAEGPVLSTLHGAKGLEWDGVWIMGLEEGVLPDPRCDIEEERRLMYVGMTRARRALYVSHAVINEYGDPIAPSRFLAESALATTPHRANGAKRA